MNIGRGNVSGRLSVLSFEEWRMAYEEGAGGVFGKAVKWHLKINHERGVFDAEA